MIIQTPINNLSFGNVGTNILRELYKAQKDVLIFPVSNVNLEAFEPKQDFIKWLSDKIQLAPLRYSKNMQSLKLWHIQGAESSIGRTSLFTFHETDTLTDLEVNILNNQERVYVSSEFTKGVFETFGVKNVHFAPLGFDSDFHQTERLMPEEVTVWGLFGKLEPCRKRHLKTIKAWVRKYGNDPKHVLHLHLFNHFIDVKEQNQILNKTLGKEYKNVNVIPFISTNRTFNQSLNAVDIVMGMSGGEGCDLPVFQCICLGKHGVVLNAHAYQSYYKDEVTWVNPSGKIVADDGKFFRPGLAFNQGYFFDWNEDDFLTYCDEVYKKSLSNRLNDKGLLLQEKFSTKNMVKALGLL
jgi:hypothetical protein